MQRRRPDSSTIVHTRWKLINPKSARRPAVGREWADRRFVPPDSSHRIDPVRRPRARAATYIRGISRRAVSTSHSGTFAASLECWESAAGAASEPPPQRRGAGAAPPSPFASAREWDSVTRFFVIAGSSRRTPRRVAGNCLNGDDRQIQSVRRLSPDLALAPLGRLKSTNWVLVSWPVCSFQFSIMPQFRLHPPSVHSFPILHTA
ncbi:hypothetical protein EVAR_97750_1 [Eumeta japonica]|uniref:Uncharacterized protein n=1 Tax=Eumeta variegata TaxID=151549 RepID=A0A4C1X645_EUMVA|nr:hypothetical protein EVAR_97750_1 [Eumeta japonica]